MQRLDILDQLRAAIVQNYGRQQVAHYFAASGDVDDAESTASSSAFARQRARAHCTREALRRSVRSEHAATCDAPPDIRHLALRMLREAFGPRARRRACVSAGDVRCGSHAVHR